MVRNNTLCYTRTAHNNKQASTTLSVSETRRMTVPHSSDQIQVIPVKINNGSKTLDVNALFDSGSDATLITSKLVHQLHRKGEMKQLNISNTIWKSVKVKSKLVTFQFHQDTILITYKCTMHVLLIH